MGRRFEKSEKKGDDRIIISSLIDEDKSPFNLSSIVCLIQFGGKKILLTGDSRTDDILEGLKLNGLLNEAGQLKVDILKLPHHGSARNASQEFYQKVTADHYVISADGKHGNPDQLLLDLLAEEILTGTLYFTNQEGEDGLRAKMDSFSHRLQADGSALTIQYREPDKRSFLIHLGTPF